MKLLSQILIEFFGVFFLCLFGGISIIYWMKNDLNFSTNSLVSISLVHSFILNVFINIGVYFDCGHINPAVSVALLILKKIDLFKCFFFILAQFFGSICAGYFFNLFSDLILLNSNTYYGSPFLNTSFINGVICEALGTFLLVWVILVGNFYKKKLKNEILTLVISFTVAINILSIGSLTGSALNPARVLGPLLFSKNIDINILVYFIGPFAGGIIAAILYFLTNKNTINQNKIIKLNKLKDKELIIE